MNSGMFLRLGPLRLRVGRLGAGRQQADLIAARFFGPVYRGVGAGEQLEELVTVRT